MTQSKKIHSTADVSRAVSLFFAVRRIMRTMLAHDTTIDVSTWPQIETLKFIQDNSEPKIKDIAEYLYISAPSATALITKLVKHGYVALVADTADRRTSRLSLTKKGEQELTKAMARGVAVLGTLFNSLSQKELATFTTLLKRLKDRAS